MILCREVLASTEGEEGGENIEAAVIRVAALR